MRARKDEDSLIGIRQQHLLIVSLWTRIQPDDGALAFLDLFNHTTPIGQDRDLHLIANRGDITFCATLFQLAAQLANDKALTGLNSKETRLGFDDQTLERLLFRQIFTTELTENTEMF